MARVSTGKATGDGHRTVIATSETAAEIPQPATRSGISESGPGQRHGSTNASSSGVVALATTELTTAPKSTMNPTANMPIVASAVEFETSVPRQIITMQAMPRSACDRNRSSRVPPKSTRSSIPNAPKAMK